MLGAIVGIAVVGEAVGAVGVLVGASVSFLSGIKAHSLKAAQFSHSKVQF